MLQHDAHHAAQQYTQVASSDLILARNLRPHLLNHPDVLNRTITTSRKLMGKFMHHHHHRVTNGCKFTDRYLYSFRRTDPQSLKLRIEKLHHVNIADRQFTVRCGDTIDTLTQYSLLLDRKIGPTDCTLRRPAQFFFN